MDEIFLFKLEANIWTISKSHSLVCRNPCVWIVRSGEKNKHFVQCGTIRIKHSLSLLCIFKYDIG